MFDEIFDKAFKKYVQTDTFRLPMSVKELRLFSHKICQSFADEYLCTGSELSRILFNPIGTEGDFLLLSW